MPVPITLLYGGLTALLVTLLGANVSRLRLVLKAGPRDVPPELVRPVRAHGNSAEWAALGLLLLLVLELSHAAGSAVLHLFGGLFLLGRALHAYGLYARSPLHMVGATINYLVLLAMSARAIWFHFVQ
jgi:uncharacterized protein